MDKYSSFEELRTSEKEGTDYRVRWRIGRTGIAILSIHGGEIEPGTSRIADAIAGGEHTFYALEGMKQAGNRVLHITSAVFDEPVALEIVCRSNIIISIHGCAETEEVVYVGGRDQLLRRRIQLRLKDAGFTAEESDNPSFQGINEANICNLCGGGMGVQLEISRGTRSRMFRDLTAEGRKQSTVVLQRFVDAVRDAIEPFSRAFLDPEPLDMTD